MSILKQTVFEFVKSFKTEKRYRVCSLFITFCNAMHKRFWYFKLWSLRLLLKQQKPNFAYVFDTQIYFCQKSCAQRLIPLYLFCWLLVYWRVAQTNLWSLASGCSPRHSTSAANLRHYSFSSRIEQTILKFQTFLAPVHLSVACVRYSIRHFPAPEFS